MDFQLHMVTYTGGLNRDGGTPVPGDRISCIASGVPRNLRRALAAVLRCWRSSKVAYQHASTGTPGTSTRDSPPRLSCCDTRCSIAGATPAPSAAAAQAAVWLGNTPMLLSGTPSCASSRPVSLPGSVPAGSTSQRHCRAGPRGLDWPDWPAVTATTRYLKIGSLTIGIVCSLAEPSPMATSASLFAMRTACSPDTATPVDTSTGPGNRLVNASTSGPAMNSPNVDVATIR